MNIQGRESLITQCSWETDIYSTIFLYFPHLRAVLQWCGKGDYFEFMIMKQRNILKGPCQDWGFWYWYRPSSGLAFGYLCILPQTILSSAKDPFCKSVEITHCRDLLKSDHSKREKNCFWAVSTGLPGPGNEQRASQAIYTCALGSEGYGYQTVWSCHRRVNGLVVLKTEPLFSEVKWRWPVLKIRC